MSNSYVNELLVKFNENPDHPDLNEQQKVLLRALHKIAEETQQVRSNIDGINSEIAELNKKRSELIGSLGEKIGESNGYVGAIINLEKTWTNEDEK